MKHLGTDLIAEDQHRTCAIQAKFYQAGNTVPNADIDSFLSDPNRPKIDYRLLIGTGDGLGKTLSRTLGAKRSLSSNRLCSKIFRNLLISRISGRPQQVQTWQLSIWLLLNMGLALDDIPSYSF